MVPTSLGDSALSVRYAVWGYRVNDEVQRLQDGYGPMLHLTAEQLNSQGLPGDDQGLLWTAKQQLYVPKETIEGMFRGCTLASLFWALWCSENPAQG
jgi:hypothetical protein